MEVENDERPWHKPLDLNGIKDSSKNWTLASDAGVRFRVTIVYLKLNKIYQIFFVCN
jgi:hypothetical protein